MGTSMLHVTKLHTSGGDSVNARGAHGWLFGSFAVPGEVVIGARCA
jgi:hypothetical protein